MEINPVFSKLFDLVTRGGGPTIRRFELRPIPEPDHIAFELSDGKTVELRGDYSQEQLEYWFHQARRIWECGASIGHPASETDA